MEKIKIWQGNLAKHRIEVFAYIDEFRLYKGHEDLEICYFEGDQLINSSLMTADLLRDIFHAYNSYDSDEYYAVYDDGKFEFYPRFSVNDYTSKFFIKGNRESLISEGNEKGYTAVHFFRKSISGLTYEYVFSHYFDKTDVLKRRLDIVTKNEAKESEE